MFELIDGHKIYTASVNESDEMRLRIQELYISLYGRNHALSTRYFLFIGHVSFTEFDELVSCADDKYQSFCTMFDLPLTAQNPVIFHETHQAFKSAIGRLDAPNWARIGWNWGIIHIAPDDTFKDISQFKSFIHGIYQSTLEINNPTLPYWFLQGLSSYLSGWLDQEYVREILKDDPTKVNLVHSFAQLNNDFVDFFNKDMHIISYTFMGYLYDRKGVQFIKDFIHQSEVIPDSWINEWKQYVKEVYLK
jgi:hypothetical protein